MSPTLSPSHLPESAFTQSPVPLSHLSSLNLPFPSSHFSIVPVSPICPSLRCIFSIPAPPSWHLSIGPSISHVLSLHFLGNARSAWESEVSASAERSDRCLSAERSFDRARSASWERQLEQCTPLHSCRSLVLTTPTH